MIHFSPSSKNEKHDRGVGNGGGGGVGGLFGGKSYIFPIKSVKE